MAEPKPDESGVVSAAELRMKMLERELHTMEEREKAGAAEQERRAAFARSFLNDHVSEDERAMIRRIVMKAVENGKMEALVYSFPSSLCTDGGRAINNADPDWPQTLQGKAREIYERYLEQARPAGYRLKAMIVDFPGGMPGDVGFFLNWEPEAV